MHGSDVVTIFNVALAVADVIMVLALVVALMARLRVTQEKGMTGLSRGHVHAVVGTMVLFLYGSLGFVTAMGALLRHEDDYILLVQMLAAGLRVGIFLLLAAWTAWTLEYRYRGRWPRLDHGIDRFLRPLHK